MHVYSLPSGLKRIPIALAAISSVWSSKRSLSRHSRLALLQLRTHRQGLKQTVRLICGSIIHHLKMLSTAVGEKERKTKMFASK